MTLPTKKDTRLINRILYIQRKLEAKRIESSRLLRTIRSIENNMELIVVTAISVSILSVAFYGILFKLLPVLIWGI